MAEDWLPHEPPPQSPPKSSAKTTIMIWLVLIVMFIAIYNLIGTSPRGRGAVVEQTGFAWWWLAIAGVIGLALPIAFMAVMFRGSEKFNTAQSVGLDAIARGQYAKAVDIFEALAKRFRTKPNFAAVARYNQGYALLLGGDSAAAVGVLLAAERTPKLALGGVRRMTAGQLARAFALGGDVDKATQWLEALRKRPATGDHAYCQALLDAVEALVLCRQGKYTEATAVYERAWPLLEAYLPVHQMREAWLLRAYSITMTSSVRDGGAAEPWLRMIRGTPPGGFVWLTAHWPELATFTTTHGHGTAEAAA
jgi:tetratricopeptide (TPR) repeat protein